MKWSEFNNTCEKYFSTPGSTWYHREIELRGAKVVAFVANSIGMSPNVLTLLSTLFAVVGMVVILLRPNDWMAGVLSLLLLQLCFIADCSDGILARFQNRSSKFGAFLDIFLDRLNNFVVFGGFGVAWAVNSPSSPSLLSVVLFMSAASAYILYTIAAMQQGFVFPDFKGTMQNYGKSWKEKVLKFPYEFMNMGVHFLLLSLSYLMGLIYPMVIFYGILGGSMTIAMIVYLYFKDAKKII